MSGDERVLRQFALREEKGASLIVARAGETKTLALPKRLVAWKRLPGRVVEGPHGLKLALVEVEMPAWLARDRGIG